MASRLQSQALGRVQASLGRSSGLKAPLGSSLRIPNTVQLRNIGHAPLRPSARSSIPAAFPSHSRSFFWRASPAASAPAASISTSPNPSSPTDSVASTSASSGTLSPPTAPAATNSAPTPAASPAHPSSGYEIPDLPSPSPASLPDLFSVPTTVDIGYLHSLGLEYSYLNPATYLEWVLEHVHVYSGMPWWGSIVATVLVFRLALLKPTLSNNQIMTKISVLAPITRPLSAEITKATQEKNMELATQKRTELLAINRRMGTRIQDMVRFPLLQGLVGFGTFKLMRDMASIPVPGLETGGFWWLTNLAVPDPYYIVPLVQFVFMATTMNLVRERASTGPALSKRATQAISIGMATLMSGFSAFMPAGLQIAFFISALWQQSVNMLLTYPTVRALLNLLPLPSPGLANAGKVARLEDKITVGSWQRSGAGLTAGPDSLQRGAALKVVSKGPKEQPSLFKSMMSQVETKMNEMGYSKKDDVRAKSRQRGREREREWYEKYKKSMERSS